MLPPMIVGRKSKRMRRLHRLMTFLRDKEIEEGNGDQMDANATDPIELDTTSLLSKVTNYKFKFKHIKFLKRTLAGNDIP